MGGILIKYFLMKGLVYREEFKVVVEVCVKYDFYLELIGGIDFLNFEEILKIVIDVGVKKVIFYVYSLIIDKEIGDMCIGDVRILLSMVKKIIY